MSSFTYTILSYGVYVEIFCAIIAFIYGRNSNIKMVRVFVAYLLLVPIIECTAGIITDLGYENNQWLYNILGVAEITAISILIGFNLRKRSLKNLVLLCFGLGILVVIADIIFIGPPFFKTYLNHAFGLHSLLILIIAFVYLFDLIISEDYMTIKRNLLSWVCLALILYHACTIPFTIISNYYNSVFKNEDLIYLIQGLASIIMYALFSIEFLWNRKKLSI